MVMFMDWGDYGSVIGLAVVIFCIIIASMKSNTIVNK